MAVGVSGGPDSMALCHMLSQWSEMTNGPQIHALTVDHNLRTESKDEASLVAFWLKDFPKTIHSILFWQHDCGEALSSRIQERARDARYALLADYMARHKISHLFMAHHQDDQAETFLFRLAKGSGLDGLVGMLDRHCNSQGLEICRPLLGISKKALVTYCENAGLSYCLDPSNNSLVYARVRLRNAAEALYAEGLSSKRLAITARRFARARDALEKIAKQNFTEALVSIDTNCIVLNYTQLIALPEEIGLRIVIQAINHLSIGRKSKLRLERAENLFFDLVKPFAFRKRTLSGVVINRDDKNSLVVFMRELR